ncbi:hypothetical protein FIBSPDRAFT_897303 [Athelia psychrophila]|uniref:Carbamoyl phosphate synthase ATP-binding domain-containing protein n=1 Tax=Athelia psychrophila TaxID=1759441 RepID=A0A166CCP3_9AGAM|nr:hypothetical protein FIBSPDRAFT_897303 [Fibularhizoctonia sp. CBS 109695]
MAKFYGQSHFASSVLHRSFDGSQSQQHKAPTSTQATVSSGRVLRSSPIFPPPNLDDQMAARTRHCAHLLSCDLAVAQDVPVAPGTHVKSAAHVRALLLDCGGGRGIRVIRAEEDIEEAFKRCIGESHAGQLFPEKALSGPDGMHIEVHILAAAVFQKVVEVNGALHHLPPSHEIQLSPAPRLDEDGTGTFEYLVNFHNGERVFLEINPRILVKHTVTACPLYHHPRVPQHHPSLHGPPQSCALQLRLTAEDPAKDFRLSAELHRVARGAWGARRYVAFRCSPASWEQRFIRCWGRSWWCAGGIWGDNAEGGACLRETSMGNDNEEGVKMNEVGGCGAQCLGKERCDTMWLERELWDVAQIWREVLKPKSRQAGLGLDSFIVRQAWIGRRESTLGGDLGIAGNAAWRDIPSHLIPAWIQRHLRREEACPDTRLHRVQRLSHTSLRHASKHVLAFSARISLKQGQSPASVSAGAFDLADLNDSTQVAAPPMGKIVELHLAVWPSGGGEVSYDRGVGCGAGAERGGRAVRGNGAGVGVVVRRRDVIRATDCPGENDRAARDCKDSNLIRLKSGSASAYLGHVIVTRLTSGRSSVILFYARLVCLLPDLHCRETLYEQPPVDNMYSCNDIQATQQTSYSPHELHADLKISKLASLTGQTLVTSKTRYTVRAFGIRRNEKIAVHVTIRRSKAEEILGRGLKVQEYGLRKNFLETGNCGFCVQELIDFGPRYDPGIGIFGMDLYMIMGRPGARVARRKR